MHILTLYHADLESELREKIVGSLVLLRRKEIIDSSTLESMIQIPMSPRTDYVQASTYALPNPHFDTKQISENAPLPKNHL